ncbi:MAG: sigma-70 family RNA polymerase sigma factor [Chitinispirillaceae bacterium]|nr:sigma-70 family RNA polymerase sigma factor [Chitinispirillaceae bacterium]
MAINAEQMYRTYGPMIMRRCRQLLRDEDTALDALQEVFVQLLLKKDDLTAAYPSTLLYTMATNICLNMLRSGKRMALAGDSDGLIDKTAAIEDAAAVHETRSLLGRIFGREKASSRYIAVLHFVDGMTLEEVAEEVNMSVSGVRKRLRNLQAQAKSLKERENE